MNEVYNLRIGDMIYNDKAYAEGSSAPEKANIVAIIYKMILNAIQIQLTISGWLAE